MAMHQPIDYSSISKRVRVLFDVDGVIADYAQAHVLAVIATGVRSIPESWRPTEWDIDNELNLTAEEKAKVWGLLCLPGVAQRLVPFVGAVEAVKRIAKVADVYFVTTPMSGSPTWPYDRSQWLITHFGDDVGERVVHTQHKHLISGHHLVDDKIDNCRKWEAYNPCGISLRYRSPEMDFAKDLVNVTGWDAVERFIQTTIRLTVL